MRNDRRRRLIGEGDFQPRKGRKTQKVGGLAGRAKGRDLPSPVVWGWVGWTRIGGGVDFLYTGFTGWQDSQEVWQGGGRGLGEGMVKRCEVKDFIWHSFC